MGQRLYLIKNDPYRLNVYAFKDPEFDRIREGESTNRYRLSIKEKLSNDSLEKYEGDIVEGAYGFSMCSQLQFGTYLYVIEKVNMAGELKEECAYGFIDIMPDV